MNQSWYARLRWLAIASQCMVIAGVYFLIDPNLKIQTLAFIIFLELVIGLLFNFKSQNVFFILALDVFFLSLLLYFSGGPYNPFSILFVIHIAIAAMVLSRSKTFLIAVESLLLFAFLFVDHVPLHSMHHHTDEMNLHLYGMWLAFGVTGLCTAYFLNKLKGDLIASQQRATRLEKYALMGTFVTSAAHELASPLNSIDLIANDLVCESNNNLNIKEDLQVLKNEVKRCKTILDELSFKGGSPISNTFETFDLVKCIHDLIKDKPDIVFKNEQLTTTLHAPYQLFKRALGNLIDNALQAKKKNVTIEIIKHRQHVEIIVDDDGEGFTKDTLRQFGEPMSSTKETGLGLGLFVAKQVIEQLSGSIVLCNNSDGGRVKVSIPHG